MTEIFVKKWLDYETKEADVVIRTDGAEFSVFAARYEGGISLPVTLYAMFTEDAFLSGEEPSITKCGDGEWSYRIVGEVQCTEPPCVKLCESVYIELDGSIPRDIKTGENIEFCAGRLDLY